MESDKKDPKRPSKKIFFRAVDKQGVNVILEKRCWYGHILIYHNQQMSHRLHDIKATIEYADRIDESLEDGIKNRVYYKRWHDRDRFGNPFLLVATEVLENNMARVLSAYPLFTLPCEGDHK